MSHRTRRPLRWFLLFLALIPGMAVAQSQPKPILGVADYNRFETIASDAISPDGKWYAYRITRGDAEGDLRYKRLDVDLPETMVPNGLTAAFTRDSRFLVWTAEPSSKEKERLLKEKKPVLQSLTVRNLSSGAQQSYEGVRAFLLSPDARYVAIMGNPPTEIRGSGGSLRVVELQSGTEVTFQDVGEARWSEAGTALAMTIATGTALGNGVQLYDPATGRLRSLENSPSSYHGLTFRKGSADLALFKTNAPMGTETKGEAAIVWRSITTNPTRVVLDSSNTMLGTKNDLVDLSSLRWSTDGQTIAIALKPRSAPQDSTAKRGATNSDSTSSVQIWHANDVLIYPAQQSRLAGESRRTLLALWQIGTGKVTQVSSDLTASATLLEGWHHAVEKPADAYDWGTMFGRRYHDVFLTDLATGNRTKVLTKVRYSSESTEGRYLMWYDGKDYWTYEIATGVRHNITTGLKTTFTNAGYDTPTDLVPSYGAGGWLAGDKAVFLYDQYDVWKISPDGVTREKLTSGRSEEKTYRVLRMAGDNPSVDPTAPMYFTIRGERDKRMGWARLTPGSAVQQLVFGDKAFGQLKKADSVNVFMYRAEDRADSPDNFVTGADFASPRQVTNTNPFLKDVAWTHEELISFKSEGGIPLQGILLYPANYDPAKKYPMIVYTYERLSDGLHSFQAPSERSYYNYTVWTLNGYFVLMPDIVFKPREPGISTLQSVRAAVKTVTARGLVDPKRVGHIGHSWGGFEAAFLGTHGGDFLATTIAGAAITDLVSFMGQIHWNGGTAESDHSETGQARMEVPYWEDPAAHKRNSPIENVQNMTIPMMLAQGNKDGTVEFFQGTEFYNFARRAGKQVVLLVYDGEDHGFSKKANQVDYQRRILEWFGHYLKGEPAPAWITNGIKAGDLAQEVKRVADKKGNGG